MKTFLALLLLIPCLGWSKDYLYCRGTSDSGTDWETLYFEVINSKSIELMTPHIYYRGGFNLDLGYRIQPTLNKTDNVYDEIFLVHFVEFPGKGLTYRWKYILDTTSGFMINTKYYTDERGPYTIKKDRLNKTETMIYNDDDPALFNENVDKKYFECEKSKNLLK